MPKHALVVEAIELQPPAGGSSLDAIQERPSGQLPDATETKVLDRLDPQVDIFTVTVEVGVKVNHALAPVLQGVD